MELAKPLHGAEEPFQRHSALAMEEPPLPLMARVQASIVRWLRVGFI